MRRSRTSSREVAEAIQANPREFLWRVRAYERRTPEVVAQADLRSFERYLDSHGEVAEDLYRDPDLINDSYYVRSHRSLQEWLEDHPKAAAAIRERPREFVWRDRNLSIQDFPSRLFR